jgi:hypothetical protein
MSPPVNLHWVPKFYLRYFATPETRKSKNPQVWVFSKEDNAGNPSLTNIRNICAKRYLYAPVDDRGKRDWTLETKLERLEAFLVSDHGVEDTGGTHAA